MLDFQLNINKFWVVIFLNLNICQVAKKSKYFENPYDCNNDNHNIEEVFDFVIHGNVCIDSP